MAPANLRTVKNRQTTQDLAHAAMVAHNAKSNDRIKPCPISVSKGRYLDVDRILERSLPNVVSK
jgi:hypothetical protein